jgi:hypothetical protein
MAVLNKRCCPRRDSKERRIKMNSKFLIKLKVLNLQFVAVIPLVFFAMGIDRAVMKNAHHKARGIPC